MEQNQQELYNVIIVFPTLKEMLFKFLARLKLMC